MTFLLGCIVGGAVVTAIASIIISIQGTQIKTFADVAGQALPDLEEGLHLAEERLHDLRQAQYDARSPAEMGKYSPFGHENYQKHADRADNAAQRLRCAWGAWDAIKSITRDYLEEGDE